MDNYYNKVMETVSDMLDEEMKTASDMLNADYEKLDITLDIMIDVIIENIKKDVIEYINKYNIDDDFSLKINFDPSFADFTDNKIMFSWNHIVLMLKEACKYDSSINFNDILKACEHVLEVWKA